MAQPSHSPLSVRLLADRSIVVKHHDDGRKTYALDGLVIEGETPKRTKVPTSWVDRGMTEGWLEAEGLRAKVVPSGPTENPWGGQFPPHVFKQADAIVFKCVDGDVRYKVTRQPDKYDAAGEPSDVCGDSTATIDHHYELELED